MERVRCDVKCATRGETALGVWAMLCDATTLGDASRGDAKPICCWAERLVCRGVETCRRSTGRLESAKLMSALRGTDLVCVVAMREGSDCVLPSGVQCGRSSERAAPHRTRR